MTRLRQLDRYDIIASIARGGMATVLLARLAGVGGFRRLQAIKLLHRHLARDEEFLSMLLDEARIAARIHHPNVVGIHEVVDNPDHGHYLVMDYIEGFTLAQVLTRLGKNDPRMRMRIACRSVLDALYGLHAAHTLVDDSDVPLGVIHRDVSPQNIIIGVDGVSRVTDFGVAKAEARLSETRPGDVKGKLGYMSPEQVAGGKLDARSDLFAVGVVLWESLAGRRLFTATQPLAVAKLVTEMPIGAPTFVGGAVPEALAAVTARSLDRDVTKRFQTARSMAQALEAAARASDCLGDAIELGEWLSDTFRDQLIARRASIRSAVTETAAANTIMLPGGNEVPRLDLFGGAAARTPRGDEEFDSEDTADGVEAFMDDPTIASVQGEVFKDDPTTDNLNVASSQRMQQVFAQEASTMLTRIPTGAMRAAGAEARALIRRREAEHAEDAGTEPHEDAAALDGEDTSPVRFSHGRMPGNRTSDDAPLPVTPAVVPNAPPAGILTSVGAREVRAGGSASDAAVKSSDATQGLPRVQIARSGRRYVMIAIATILIAACALTWIVARSLILR